MNNSASLRETTQSTMLRSTQENDRIRYDSDFARIEELIKSNSFTREEITSLIKILNSRVDEEEHKSGSSAGGDARLVPWIPEVLETPSEGKRQFIERTVNAGYHEKSDVQVGASPIDLARAYMAGRTTEEGQDLHNLISNNQRTQPTNEFARKPLLLSAPSLKPSICWPGAVVHDRPGQDHTTPQSQRARNRLHDFPRMTPYSRATLSKSTTKLSKSTTKLQADSGCTSTSSPFPQSRTPLFGQGKLRGETVDLYGSAGPIRRIRSSFSSEVHPRGSIFLSSRKEIPPKVPTSQVFGGYVPNAERNFVPGETSGVSKYCSGDNVSHTPDRGVPNTNTSSNQAAGKALGLLDPTPKEKEDEPTLVIASGSSPDATDVSNVEHGTPVQVEEPASHTSTSSLPLEFNRSSSKFSFLSNSQGKGMNEARDAATGTAIASTSIFTCSSSSMSGTDQMPVFGLTGTSGPHAKILNKSSQFSLPPLSNGQESKISNEAEAWRSHGTKHSLPSISINRRSDNGLGFTFPVSASAGVLSQPPTPTFAPSSSASIKSQPISTPSNPSYSFDSKKSAPRVVFSFPSTSSASNHDDSDPKFSFGSDKKTRLSFSSFGEDATFATNI